MEPIRTIHVGLGAWGSNWATSVLAGHPEVDVLAYVDRDSATVARMQQRLGLPPEKFFPSLEAAMAAVDAEAVIVALPIALHAPVAWQALEAGKHVVVEKPFTENLQEARDLVALAEARGLVLAVSQNYRFYPAPQMAAQLTRGAYLGRLASVNVDFRRNAFAERSSNLKIPHPLLRDMAIHHYDLMRLVIGEDPVEVSARTWNPPGSPYEMHPAGAMVFSFPSGVHVSYRGSWVDFGPQTPWGGDWKMDFEKGSITWTSRGDQPWPMKRDTVQIRRPNATMEEVALPEMRFHDRAGTLAAFAQAIRTGTEPLHFPSGRNNIMTLAIAEAALQSSLNGGAPVRLDSL